MGADYACKESEAQYPLSVGMYEAFIVDESDIVIKDGLEHGLVGRLFLFGVREEQVCFTRDEPGGRYFFDAEEDIAVGEIFEEGNACAAVFFICKAAGWGGLCNDIDLLVMFVDPACLAWGESYPVVVFFPDESYCKHIEGFKDVTKRGQYT